MQHFVLVPPFPTYNWEKVKNEAVSPAFLHIFIMSTSIPHYVYNIPYYVEQMKVSITSAGMRAWGDGYLLVDAS